MINGWKKINKSDFVKERYDSEDWKLIQSPNFMVYFKDDETLSIFKVKGCWYIRANPKTMREEVIGETKSKPKAMACARAYMEKN